MANTRDMLLKALEHNMSVDPEDTETPMYAIDTQYWFDYDIGADGKPTNRVVHSRSFAVPCKPVQELENPNPDPQD